MVMATRKATAIWEGGGLKKGAGSFKTEQGIEGKYSFTSRFENGTGSNPEELLAAAHAACYSMALSVGLEQAGKPPQKVETNAACTVEKVGDGFKITTMKLVVRAQVPGLDDATFQKVALATKEGCPVSGALKGNVSIDLDAKLM
jgi:osmotically inducible protein OsmC